LLLLFSQISRKSKLNHNMAYPAADSGPRLDIQLKSVPLVTTLRNRPDGSSGAAPPVVILDRHTAADVPHMRALLNHAIVEHGHSYPLRGALTDAQFAAYFTSHDTFVLRLAVPRASDQTECGGRYNFGRALVGCVHIKPNFPGRCDHICNGAFLVVPAWQRCGAAMLLGRRFQLLAHELGYDSSMFNLVFTANQPSVRLWDQLGYDRVGVVARAGRLGKHDAMSDAIVFTCDLRRVEVPPRQLRGAVASWEDAALATVLRPVARL
jgi:GNAT superfamily N-acetyltransferase